MCFSKEASFIASGVLATVGAFSAGIAIKRKQTRFIPFALIPLCFAIQQFFEGLVWWSLETDAMQTTQIFSLCYLFFALFFWPFWVPLSLFCFERKRKFLFSLFTIYGGVVGIGIFVSYLWSWHNFTTLIIGHSISYEGQNSSPYEIGLILYIIATVGSMSFSSNNFVKILGALIAILALISYLINQCAFFSLWCFFSAAISVLIAAMVAKETELQI